MDPRLVSGVKGLDARVDPEALDHSALIAARSLANFAGASKAHISLERLALMALLKKG